MNHEVIQRLLDHWNENFFTEPFVLLSFIFCFIAGFIYDYKQTERFLFLIYSFSGIILFGSGPAVVSLKIFSGRNSAIFLESANTIFELIEFTAFYYFFKRCLRNKHSKKVLLLFLYSLIIFAVIFFNRLTSPSYKTYNIMVDSLFINVAEFFFLFIICLIYFYELFTDIPEKDLFRRPSFFIVTSVFFYTILTIPFFLIAQDLLMTEKEIFDVLFATHYVLLIILLTSISKALLCKAPITI